MADLLPGDENTHSTNVSPQRLRTGPLKDVNHDLVDQVGAAQSVKEPHQKVLEPSLQAWAASQRGPRSDRLTRNVGASEHVVKPPSDSGDHDWMNTLRDEEPEEQARSRGRAWRPKITVAKEPYFRTARRARSRSATPSGGVTPESTPRRHVATTQRSSSEVPASARAVKQHLERMVSGRQMSASPLRRTHNFSGRCSSPSPSPARSVSSQRSDLSTDSRLSQLSKPRSLSARRPGVFGSAEIEKKRLEKELSELRELRKCNEHMYRQAINNPDPVLGVSAKSSRFELTKPAGPQLQTERRSVLSQVSALHRASSGTANLFAMAPHPIEREQAAIERHMRLSAAAQLPAAGVDLDQWIRGALKAEERAQRARLVAEARRETAGAHDKARLCVFKPPGAGPNESGREVSQAEGNPPSKAAEGLTAAEEMAQRARSQAHSQLGHLMAQENARFCVFKGKPHSSAPSVPSVASLSSKEQQKA